MTAKRSWFTAWLFLFTLSTSLAQGKWTLGLEVANRSELRKYEDSYQYLFKGTGGSAAFPVGMNLAFQYSERWRFESGIISTPYSRTVAVYYNEPGYTRIANRPVSYRNHMATLEIPLRIVYNTNLRWKSIQFNVMGGLNTYLLAESIDSRGKGGLPAIPVWPSAPTNLSVVYEDRNLSKINFSLEAGGEAMWDMGKRFVFIYRFSGRMGFIDMVEMKGEYLTGENLSVNPTNSYPFRVIANGSALHHTFSLRYRLGKKIEKENWWEDED
jgi:hypothetical protein